MKVKKGQISVEYIIIVGFVTFVLISLLLIAYSYSNLSGNQMRYIQTEAYAKKIISSAETVYYSGSPSKATITVYVPAGVSKIELIDNQIVLSVDSQTGTMRTAYSSNVPIIGNFSSSPGIKKIKLEAISNYVRITEG
jgi:uncharacterized protein (UPF0333 family)